MSKFVILANVGNRHLKLNNQHIPKENFFTETKRLCESDPENRKNISLHILPEILAKYSGAILYLFTSRQEIFNEQDTYYAGLLIKEMLDNEGKLEAVEILCMDQKDPSNEEQLIPWYLEQIEEIQKKWENVNYVYFETGGTPQQKNALRSTLEFKFQGIRGLKFYQGKEDRNGGTEVKELTKSASEKFQLLTSIRNLVMHHNYDAAIVLARDTQKLLLCKALEYSSMKWNSMWSVMKNEFKKTEKYNQELKRYDQFIELNDEINLKYDVQYFADLTISPKVFRNCRNLFAKSACLADKGDKSYAVLAFHQGIEYFVSGIIETNTPFAIQTDRYKYENPLLEYLNEQHSDELTELFNNAPTHLSFPVQVYYAIKIAEKNNPKLLGVLYEIRDSLNTFKSEKYKKARYLDSIRNGIAHEGKGISNNEYDNFNELFKSTYILFKVEEHNPFVQLNLLLERIIINSYAN